MRRQFILSLDDLGFKDAIGPVVPHMAVGRVNSLEYGKHPPGTVLLSRTDVERIGPERWLYTYESTTEFNPGLMTWRGKFLPFYETYDFNRLFQLGREVGPWDWFDRYRGKEAV